MKHASQTLYLLQSVRLSQPPFADGSVTLETIWSVSFSNFGEARECMHILQQDAIKEYCNEDLLSTPLLDKQMLDWRFLIREVLLDDDDGDFNIDLNSYLEFEKKGKAWCYNVADALLWTLPVPATDTDFQRVDFEGEFQFGDTVYIRPQALEPTSLSIYGNYGVVCEVPESKQSWLASSKPQAGWNANYRIQYIDAFGFLTEYRLPKCCLMAVHDELPKELSFLPIWAMYLKGKATFPDGLADRIRARKVHLLNIPRYDFRKSVKRA